MRAAEAGCMHVRPNPCPTSPFQEWGIQPVREYTDYNGGTFFEPCESDDSLDDDHPDAVGPVLFGVYLHAISGDRRGEWMNVRDFATYEQAIEFLDDVTGRMSDADADAE